ncbi:hypothetical protein [Solihabitans fulvus]|uniref:hypothetical protein n=1 Tax=Solihabitans fulvus TaxID=1892852 RepID=UPI0016620765|nr:hypothetical protein [Solihabitans fulvus]
MAIAGYFVGQYAQGTLDTLGRDHVGLAPTYAARALPVQVAFYVHIVFAGLALLLGPWQFARVLTFAQVPFVHGGDVFETISTQAYAPLPFLCWLPNLVVAEFMIRRHGLPALRIALDHSGQSGALSR